MKKPNKKGFIFLIGFMGSGKTSLGKKLALLLDYPFIDLDEKIADKEKMTVNEIFEAKGEKHFRKLELEVLNALIANETNKFAVIALGGGTPCYNDNIELIKKNGTVVYLELPIKVILGRLKKDSENRPLVKDLRPKDLMVKISDLFSAREATYLKADLVLDAQLSKSKLKKQIGEFIANQK